MPLPPISGNLRPSFLECYVGDWTSAAIEGSHENVFLPAKERIGGTVLAEFALVLHSTPEGDLWVWKRIA